MVSLFSCAQLELEAMDFGNQHETRPPSEGPRGGSSSQARLFSSLTKPGRGCVDPEQTTTCCLHCYRSETRTSLGNTHKVPPPPKSRSMYSVLHLGLQPRDRKQPRRRLVGKPALPSPHPGQTGWESEAAWGGYRVSGPFKFLGCRIRPGPSR